MTYRSPPETPPPSAGTTELNDYEQKLIRSARRKRIVIVVLTVGMVVVGLGSCLAPIVLPLAGDAWHGRKTKLTAGEAKKVSDLIDPLEADAKKSQAAFDALWPKLRAGEIGARKDLGACRVNVPGPVLRGEDSSTSLQESSQGEGWTFVDLTPASERSPIVGLKMPQGSLATNNTGQGERFVLPPRALRTAPDDRAPTLDSTTTGESVAKWRAEAAAPMRNDGHQSFVQRITSFASEGLGVDVVVFVDLWVNPKFSDAPPLTPREQLAALERGVRPRRLFEGGMAIARAFVWSPTKQQLLCASQALAQSSPDITFRSNDLAPLQQDLVLQLEKSLQRSFVAVGDAPPKIERPLRGDSAADSAPASKVRGAELPPGVLMTYASGGGITGQTTALTVFADGRVVLKSARAPKPSLRVPVARVEKLAADLAATGVFAQSDGSWTPPSPVPDGAGTKIVVRDQAGAVHAYDSATGAKAPAAVARAMRISDAFAAEVDRQNPTPPCACVAGDPLCACP